MLKKLLPIVMLVFMAACADTQGGATPDKCLMACCEKCECCKEAKCGECSKSGECKSCMKKGKQCKMGKKKKDS